MSAPAPLPLRPWPPVGPLERGWLSPSPAAPPALWCIDRRAAAVAAALPALLPLLSAPEQERLQRLRRSGDQERFALGRGALRQLLAACLDRPAGEIQLVINRHGKPLLSPDPLQHMGVPQFNVAHSGDLVLLAFHHCRPVGIDVERHRPLPAWPAIAQRCFPASLVAELEALPAEAGHCAFLRHWCRLEARLKADGTGLAAAGQGLADGTAANSATAASDPLACSDRPACSDLLLPAGYSGAVALARLKADGASG